MVCTPGDNEWTDCHRTNNGAFTPTERLDVIRQTFFNQPGRTMGQGARWVVHQRAPYVENVAWYESGVVFATVHVVGSNSDKLPWFGAPSLTQPQTDEYTARTAAGVDWINTVFSGARSLHARGVVLGVQADMWDAAFTGANDAPTQYDGFTSTVQALATRSSSFRRPVLLLNGDSHAYLDDRPLADPAKTYQRTMYGVTEDVPNLRRITVNGSTTACHEWMKLRVDRRAADLFSVERVRFAVQPGFDPVACPAS